MSAEKAVIYCRVSTEDQAENGTSLETQELTCLRKAAEIGAPVVAVRKDEGVSGALYDTRGGVQEALRDVEAGRANLLIVYSISRLSRDVEHQQNIRKRVERAGGRLVICDMPLENTEEGDLMFGVSGAFAQYERQVIRKRTVTGSRRLAENGVQPSRGRPPYGYTLVTERDVVQGRAEHGEPGTYRVREPEAGVVRDVFARYSAGASLRGLTEWLNAERVPTPKHGELWRPRTLLYILANPLYKGLATYGLRARFHDEARSSERGLKTTTYQRERASGPLHTIPAPAIVDEPTWRTCQERLSENRAKKGGNPKRRYLLSGIARCPVCGRGLAGLTTGRTRHYRCNRIESSAHAKTNYDAEWMEAELQRLLVKGESHPDRIRDAFLALRLNLESLAPADPSVIAALQKEVADLDRREATAARAQVDALMQGRATGVYDGMLHEIDERRKVVQERIREFEAEQEQFPTVNAPAASVTTQEALAALYKVLTASDVLSIEERRSVIIAFVKEIQPTESGLRVELRPLDETVQIGVVMYQVFGEFIVKTNTDELGETG